MRQASLNTGLKAIRQLIFYALCLLATPGCSSSVNPDEAEAIAMVTERGGRVEFEGEGAHCHVIKVYLHGTKVQNDDLSKLQSLKSLKSLFLGKTSIDDAGLPDLNQLTELRTLSLNATRVTDAGLKSLTDLTNLKTINLQETSVTATGAAGLKKSLPGVTVAR